MAAPDFQEQLDGMAAFGELLFAAGAAAANFESAHHRAIACREIDRIGNAWQSQLSGARAELATAIIAAVHALAAAPSNPDRALVADGLRSLVKAGRRPPPPMSAPARALAEPRRYWLERE